MEEIILLRHEMLINHPGMVKLYGFCCEGRNLAVIYEFYEFKPFYSLVSLIPKDDFTWLQRIKVSVGLAALLEFHNLDAAHIVLDEDYNPKLCDFGLISGGIFPIESSSKGCSNKKDVFAYGVILLSLISRRVHTKEDTQDGFKWALTEYEAFELENDVKNTEFSLVHKSLVAEAEFCPTDGHKITMLALECINGVEQERPTMEQVFRSLLKLEVVKQHADFLGANNTRKDGCSCTFGLFHLKMSFKIYSLYCYCISPSLLV